MKIKQNIIYFYYYVNEKNDFNYQMQLMESWVKADLE